MMIFWMLVTMLLGVINWLDWWCTNKTRYIAGIVLSVAILIGSTVARVYTSTEIPFIIFYVIEKTDGVWFCSLVIYRGMLIISDSTTEYLKNLRKWLLITQQKIISTERQKAVSKELIKHKDKIK